MYTSTNTEMGRYYVISILQSFHILKNGLESVASVASSYVNSTYNFFMKMHYNLFNQSLNKK